MTEIRNKDNDKREERRIEEKKAQNRRDIEKKMQYEPMKTFEAKLAEKTAHEITSKESQLQKQQNLKSKEEKQSLIDKIIGEASKKSSEEKQQRVAGIRKEAEEESKKYDKSTRDTEFETKKGGKFETGKTTENKEGEVSSEGYLRVAEKTDDQGTGAGAGGGGMDGDTSGQDSSDYETDHRLADKDKFDRDLQKSHKVVNRATGTTRRFGTGTFDADARDFDRQNLDEIISSVQLGINEEGDEEFSVQLSDEYFDGLTVQATRTDDGVILKFICPNITVRSTFIKFRVKVYAHFKRKNIAILRIDVI